MATNMEKWNKIVESYEHRIANGALENIVQFFWEDSVCHDCLNFPNEDINSQRVVQMGVNRKRADIVLNKNGIEECVIELKRASLTEGREQLFSYLIQIRNISIGVLACDKLHIYYYDYASMDANDARPNIEIPFERDNPDGEKFVEFFTYDSFDRNRVEEWVKNRFEEIKNARLQEANARQNVEAIRGVLSEELVLDLLKRHFLNEGYPETDIAMVLDEMLVSVERRAPVQQEPIAVVNDGAETELVYYVNGAVVTSRVFESKLTEKKSAKRKYYYRTGDVRDDVWNASSFNGNLSGNIHSSTYWRKRRETGLIKVEFFINE